MLSKTRCLVRSFKVQVGFDKSTSTKFLQVDDLFDKDEQKLPLDSNSQRQKEQFSIVKDTAENFIKQPKKHGFQDFVSFPLVASSENLSLLQDVEYSLKNF